MSQYRKKPVVVEAEQWTPNSRLDCVTPIGCQFCWPRACLNAVHTEFGRNAHHGEIETLEGNMTVSPGDWVITGINGEHYPCKPDIFEKTYEAVVERPQPS